MTRHKILLADDDEGLLRLVGTTLGTDDFDVITASDGEAAISAARAEHPELILLDINMPGLDGLEVCRLLKRDPATSAIKIVMLTASGAEQDRSRAVDAQADDYFVKPFSPVALLDKVYALLS
ncbi:MAG: response regulator [Chloroflexota bacterium]